MQQYSRPASLEDLKILVSSLNKNHVDYLLIGGYRCSHMATIAPPRTSTF